MTSSLQKSELQYSTIGGMPNMCCHDCGLGHWLRVASKCFWPLHALIIALKMMTKLLLVVATIFNFLNAFRHTIPFSDPIPIQVLLLLLALQTD